MRKSRWEKVRGKFGGKKLGKKVWKKRWKKVWKKRWGKSSETKFGGVGSRGEKLIKKLWKIAEKWRGKVDEKVVEKSWEKEAISSKK